MDAGLTLTNARGARVRLEPLGATIAEVHVPDRDGRFADVAVAAGGSAGKVVGRYANRIAHGRFALDGVTYQLATNENGNTLHGGPHGFSQCEWRVAQSTPSGATFELVSPDGDQGFPGALTVRVTYSLDDGDGLRIDYEAATQAPTVLNLTNHVYFNLTGDRANPIGSHELEITASAYTPVDAAMIPTGAFAAVAGTDLDFRVARPVGAAYHDTNLVLDGPPGELRFAARLADAASGRTVSVETTEPGLQLFTGKPGAVALETQHFPDAPNHPNFPSTALRPGETFRSTTIYRFGTETEA